MVSSKNHPIPRKSSRVFGPTIKTYNFRVQKQVSLPAVKRQSMRIAVANSLKTDKLHKLATAPADVSNAAAEGNLNTGNESTSSPARRVLRSANKVSAPAMAPPSRRGMLIATGQRRGTAARTGIGHGTTTASKKALQDKTKTQNQPGLDLSRGIPAGVENYYCIKGILAEAPLAGGAKQYLVEWDGTDPSTGMAWPFEWVRVHHHLGFLFCPPFHPLFPCLARYFSDNGVIGLLGRLRHGLCCLGETDRPPTLRPEG